MAKVFLSYRRGDSADVTGRIDDRLVDSFGRDNVFKDIDSIPLGVDFREHLTDAVGGCDVLLVVIGEGWLRAEDESGSRRLDDNADFVRIEVEAALQRDIPVVPVLLGNARMPKPEELPPSMQELSFRNATKVRPDPDFHPDMVRIIDGIRKEGHNNPQPAGEGDLSGHIPDQHQTESTQPQLPKGQPAGNKKLIRIAGGVALLLILFLAGVLWIIYPAVISRVQFFHHVQPKNEHGNARIFILAL